MTEVPNEAWYYECSCDRSMSNHYADVGAARRAGRKHLNGCPWAAPRLTPKHVRVKHFPSGRTLETLTKGQGV